MAVLDSSIANVALPTISKELNIRPADSIWIVNAYQLAVTVSLFPLASLGDIFGYRRVYLSGLAVFTVASLACAMSDSLLTLTLARIVQGLGAAGLMSVNIALIRFIYPYNLLGRGVGYNALIVAVSSAAGPSVAALILSPRRGHGCSRSTCHWACWRCSWHGGPCRKLRMPTASSMHSALC